MNTSIHYQVESKYYRRKVPNIHDDFSIGAPTYDDIAETTTKFENALPFLARQAAFSHYFSIIEVLYDGIAQELTSDAQARIDLQIFLDSGNAIELGGKNAKFKSSPDFDKGIEIYMVIVNPSKKSKEQYLIHGIRYLDYPNQLDPGIQESLQGLIYECSYHEQNGHAVSNNKEHLNLAVIGGEKVSILKTPFDWQKLLMSYKGFDLCEGW